MADGQTPGNFSGLLDEGLEGLEDLRELEVRPLTLREPAPVCVLLVTLVRQTAAVREVDEAGPLRLLRVERLHIQLHRF